MQIVIDERTGKKQKEKLEWINLCTYKVYPFLVNKNDSLNPDLFPVKVTVLNMTKTYYTVNVFSDHYKSNFNDTIWIVKLD